MLHASLVGLRRDGPSSATLAAAALAAALTLLLAAAPARGVPPRDGPLAGPETAAPSSTRARADTLTGALHRVDVPARTMEVIVGVGYALRTVQMRFDPETDVRRDGEASGPEALRRGQVVRVVYRDEAEGLAALIHVVSTPPEAGR